jgi:opacity protein-like surface antigen
MSAASWVSGRVALPRWKSRDVGIQAGYNWQFANNWVVGVEGDIGAANIHGSRTAGTDPGLSPGGLSVSFSPAFFTTQDRTNWQGTLAGRFGYAWGRTLFYGKAGVAFEDAATASTCIFGPAGQVPIGGGFFRSCLNPAATVVGAFNTPTYTRVGGVVGYGAEFDLGKNWSAKAEYDYLFFGNHSAVANDGTVVTDKAWSSQVKVGVNYRFAPTAVVAKY